MGGVALLVSSSLTLSINTSTSSRALLRAAVIFGRLVAMVLSNVLLAAKTCEQGFQTLCLPLTPWHLGLSISS